MRKSHTDRQEQRANDQGRALLPRGPLVSNHGAAAPSRRPSYATSRPILRLFSPRTLLRAAALAPMAAALRGVSRPLSAVATALCAVSRPLSAVATALYAVSHPLRSTVAATLYAVLFLYSSSARATDTDHDGLTDDVDSNAVSRAWIPWGDPAWTSGDDNTYPAPDWVLVESHLLDALYEYDPFGCILSFSGHLALCNKYLYSTKYYDWETAYYYYGYRYYSPYLHIWTAREYYIYDGNYCFIGNDPLNSYDPDGQRRRRRSTGGGNNRNAPPGVPPVGWTTQIGK